MTAPIAPTAAAPAAPGGTSPFSATAAPGTSFEALLSGAPGDAMEAPPEGWSPDAFGAPEPAEVGAPEAAGDDDEPVDGLPWLVAPVAPPAPRDAETVARRPAREVDAPPPVVVEPSVTEAPVEAVEATGWKPFAAAPVPDRADRAPEASAEGEVAVDAEPVEAAAGSLEAAPDHERRRDPDPGGSEASSVPRELRADGGDEAVEPAAAEDVAVVEHVPDPVIEAVRVRLEDDLTVDVALRDREIEVALRGSARTVEPLRQIGAELQRELAEAGYALHRFSANTGGGGSREHAPPERRAAADPGPVASTTASTARRRGLLDRVA